MMQSLLSLLSSETFWAALGSIATAIGVVVAILALPPRLDAEKKTLEKVIRRNRHHSEIDKAVLKMVRRIVKRHFKQYNDFIFLRYGSSVDPRPTKPRDLDYLVLLLGYSKEEERKEVLHGNAFVFEKLGIAIDVQYKDYNSFLFALIAGMPYEHSALARCSVLAGDTGYINWLNILRVNIKLDRDYLVNILHERIIELNKAIEDDIISGCGYGTIIDLYSLASTLVQIDACISFPPICSTTHVSAIADSEHILEILQDGEFKDAFKTVLRYFKREINPGPDLAQEIRQYKAIFLNRSRSLPNGRSIPILIP